MTGPLNPAIDMSIQLVLPSVCSVVIWDVKYFNAFFDLIKYFMHNLVDYELLCVDKIIQLTLDF